MKPLKSTAILLLAAASLALFSGCGDDRSNLLPGDTSREIIANLDTVDQLVAEGNCFDALNAAEEVRNQVEALSGNVDPVLRRNLLDGVTELQIKVQDNCEESDSEDQTAAEPEPAPEPEPVPEETTTGSSGATGSTDKQVGAAKPEPEPEPEPAPEPEPTPDPGGGGNSGGSGGSGGVSPGSGGVGP